MKTDSEETTSKTYEKKLTKKDVVHFSNFACDFCEITFKQETDLLKHVSEFHAKRYECEICSKTLLGYRRFKKHLHLHKFAEKVKEECPKCHQKFS